MFSDTRFAPTTTLTTSVAVASSARTNGGAYRSTWCRANDSGRVAVLPASEARRREGAERSAGCYARETLVGVDVEHRVGPRGASCQDAEPVASPGTTGAVRECWVKVVLELGAPRSSEARWRDSDRVGDPDRVGRLLRVRAVVAVPHLRAGCRGATCRASEHEDQRRDQWYPWPGLVDRYAIDHVYKLVRIQRQ